MYPDVRLIGSIDTVEAQTASREQTLILHVAFRSSAKGVFRVRLPLAQEYAFAPGDEVFVCGELDELGAIHPTRFGTIRKLAPRTAEMSTAASPITTPVAPASRDKDAAVERTTPTVAAMPVERSNAPPPTRSSAPSPTNGHATPARPNAARSTFAFGKPGGTFAGMAFARAGIGARPSPRPTPASPPASASPPRAFDTSARNVPSAAAPASTDARTAMHARWEPEQPVPQATTPKSRTASAEFLQDEIPW